MLKNKQKSYKMLVILVSQLLDNDVLKPILTPLSANPTKWSKPFKQLQSNKSNHDFRTKPYIKINFPWKISF